MLSYLYNGKWNCTFIYSVDIPTCADEIDNVYDEYDEMEENDDTLEGVVEKDCFDEDNKGSGTIKLEDANKENTADTSCKDLTNNEEKEDESPQILKFLEALSHQIVYMRRIYPKSIFEKHTLFRLPVHMSIHPAVTDYISESVASLWEMVEDGHEITSFSIVIISDKSKEKLVIEMAISNYAVEGFYDKDLENVFISVIRRLPLVARKFKHNKKLKDWWIEITTNEKVPLRMSRDFIWTRSTCDTAKENEIGCDDCLILPVLTIEKPFFVHIFLHSNGLIKRKLKYKKKRVDYNVHD